MTPQELYEQGKKAFASGTALLKRIDAGEFTDAAEKAEKTSQVSQWFDEVSQLEAQAKAHEDADRFEKLFNPTISKK